MSVLIKGMKKPKNCYDCPLHYGHADCSYAEIRKHGSVLETICPLIELPDHGDLIDRDELKATDSWEWIRHGAPVVIPAERSEDATN